MIPQAALLFAAVAVAAFAVAATATGMVLPILRRRAILDIPNERSSHAVPTPRGGGWGILCALVPSVAASGWLSGGWPWVLAILGGGALLAAVSWMDDRHSLPASLRFAVQIGAVTIGLTALPSDADVFQGLLPYWLDRAFAAVAWLWFVNLYNFMDGIDGLAGGEAVSIGLGICALAAFAPVGVPMPWVAAAVAGAAAGFLCWNWHPARIFMGDVGSIPLGYVLGWLLLALAASGQWIAALLLPLYFLTDATWTLLKRLVEGKPIFQAHREHFYQQAVRSGRSHASVVRTVLAANVALILLAVLSTEYGAVVLLPAALVMAVLIAQLRRERAAT
ncbi:glycosyltransferase family 4 protein [Arenibaculum sp.]|uniref:MraY family glycosyltransferase n=1 Tax=Arenibaculum sp. TaxID=2865862 RepID=UPI002E10B713|nr:glycosyltransferase family 4 protein [Arenibaculum sp.]